MTARTGDGDGNETNLAAVQPFYFFELDKGTYLRGASTWVFNMENIAYHVPLASGISKAVNVGNIVVNLFFETQYSILNKESNPSFRF